MITVFLKISLPKKLEAAAKAFNIQFSHWTNTVFTDELPSCKAEIGRFTLPDFKLF